MREKKGLLFIAIIICSCLVTGIGYWFINPDPLESLTPCADQRGFNGPHMASFDFQEHNQSITITYEKGDDISGEQTQKVAIRIIDSPNSTKKHIIWANRSQNFPIAPNSNITISSESVGKNPFEIGDTVLVVWRGYDIPKQCSQSEPLSVVVARYQYKSQ